MASHIPTKEIEVAKTVLATLYKITFDNEYEILFKVAYDLIKDTESAKEILSESFYTALETAYRNLQNEEIKNLFIKDIKASCQTHIKEIQAKREFISQLDHSTESNNSNEEEIYKAALNAFDKLPENRKKLLLEKLESGTTARMIAANNQMDKDKVEKYNWYTVKLLREFFLANFR